LTQKDSKSRFKAVHFTQKFLLLNPQNPNFYQLQNTENKRKFLWSHLIIKMSHRLRNSPCTSSKYGQNTPKIRTMHRVG
jgi:hypothetical protein